MFPLAAQLFASTRESSPRGALWPFISQKTDISRESTQYFFLENDPTYKKIKEIVCPELIDYLIQEGDDPHRLKTLHQKNFRTFPDSTRILEHRDVEGWIFKGIDDTGKTIRNAYGTTKPKSLNHVHRVFLAAKMCKTVEQQRLSVADLTHDKGIAILMPDKRLLPVQPSTNADSKNVYLVLCKKLDVYSDYDTHKKLGKLPLELQQRIAIICCKFIQSTLYVDARLGNILLHRESNLTPGKEKIILAVLDTEPHGVLNDASEHDIKEESTKFALMGLENFRESCAPYLPVFAHEAQVAIDNLLKDDSALNSSSLPKEAIP